MAAYDHITKIVVINAIKRGMDPDEIARVYALKKKIVNKILEDYERQEKWKNRYK